MKVIEEALTRGHLRSSGNNFFEGFFFLVLRRTESGVSGALLAPFFSLPFFKEFNSELHPLDFDKLDKASRRPFNPPVVKPYTAKHCGAVRRNAGRCEWGEELMQQRAQTLFGHGKIRMLAE